MFKSYDKQDDIPAEHKEHYIKGADGKWHAEIPTDHPGIKSNAQLLTDKNDALSKVAQLESDLEHAKASTLPRGHKPVPHADAALLDEIKALGTVADIKAKLDEHKTLKESVDKHQREESLKLVAKELGYDNVDAFIRLPNLPDFDIREKDGKKTVIAKLKDDKGVITEKLAVEFIESSADIAPFLSALKSTDGVRVSTAGGGGTAGGTDPFAWAREFGKNWNETNKPTTDVATSFGIAKSA